MSNTPLITIGIPVYNVEKYVEKSILSALNQDFYGSYEILIVDDCGIDNSMNIVLTICKNHSKGNIVRIIKHDSNKGLGTARNTIIENALGRYLFFLDSDDWMSESTLSSMYKKVQENPDVDIVYGGIIHVYSDGMNWQRTHYKDNVLRIKGAGAYATACLKEYIHAEWWGKLWSMDFIKRIHLSCSHRIMEDMLPHFISSVESSCIAWVPDIVIYYTIREDSIMGSSRHLNGTDELAFVYTDTIKRMQSLISLKYKDVVGVYDSYLNRVKDCVVNLNSYLFTDSQLQFISDNFLGFLGCVPNLKQIYNKHNRLLYFLTLHKQSYNQCVKVLTKTQNTLWGRLLRNVLAKLL